MIDHNSGRHLWGSVAILESETGSGKTEAALIHLVTLLMTGQVDGCFIGLPTRTSAAQIHRRVRKAIDRIFEKGLVPVTLAVPGYMTDDLHLEAVTNTDQHRDRSENWFSETSKRYLASRIAVGTVDQALLSVLDAKHSTLRWASYARSLLIVDEVHASDIYMSHLLASVVEQHVRRGGHVLLMSATLGSELAHRLLKAAGAKPGRKPDFAEATALSYPCVRHVVQGNLTTTPLPASGYRKSVTMQTSAIMGDASAVAELAASHVRRGAKVLVIRNTVSECVNVQRALEAILPKENLLTTSNGAVVPHHGRFSAPDRREVDAAIERAFGKGSSAHPIIAVGTQTIEQSLDIDADIIITDLCPIDVLLQRLGRLHRHPDRIRPLGYATPRAIVLKPDYAIESFANKSAHGIGIDRAYPKVATVMLTLREIERRGLFHIPDDNRALVESCTHASVVEGLVSTLPGLAKQHYKVEGGDYARQNAAAASLRDPNWRFGDKYFEAPTGVSSRIGEPGVRVKFLDPPPTALGFELKEMTIPAFLCKSSEGLVDIAQGLVVKHPHGIEFRVDDGVYAYGRYGLEKIDARNQPLGNTDRTNRP